MSWQAVDAVHEHSRTRGGVREILVAIATHADPCGRGARPSVETLARRTNKSERQVTRILQTLEAEYADEVRIEKGNGRGNPSSYTLLLPIGPPERVTFPAIKGDISGNLAPVKGDIPGEKGDILGTERVTFPAIKGDISGNAHIGYAPVGEPPENHKREPKENTPPAPRGGSGGVVFTADFIELWDRYPQAGKVRGSKTEAAREWGRVRPDDRALVNTATTNALRFPDFCERFAPALHRWLKDRKWEPYLEADPAKAAPRDAKRNANQNPAANYLAEEAARNGWPAAERPQRVGP